MSETESALGKKIKDFFPSGKTYVFNLDKYTCSKKSKGICYAGCKDVIRQIGNQYLYLHKSDSMYCPNLINSIIQRGFNDELYEIIIHMNKCGHYSITNGQHRLCAAAKAHISITVYQTTYDCECMVCRLKKRSILFRIKSYFALNKYYLMRL